MRGRWSRVPVTRDDIGGDSTFRAGVEVHGIAMVAYLKHLFRLSHGNAGTMSRFQIDRG